MINSQDDWNVRYVVGWKGDEMLTKDANWRQTYEPVFVLSPKTSKNKEEV